jgi:hypothetical protein
MKGGNRIIGNPEKQKDEIGPNEKINFHKQST